MKRVLFVVSIFILILSVGCGVKKTDDKNSSVVPGASASASASANTNSNENVTGKSIPKSYPTNVVPIIDGAEITDTTESKGSYQIRLKSGKKLNEIYEYYDNALQDIENGYKSNGGEGKLSIMQGVKDGYRFDVTIYGNNEKNKDDKYSVMITVIPKKDKN